MSKEYVFEFVGTKENFLNILSTKQNASYSNAKFYYFSNYMVKIVDNTIQFGVERGGHSGGYWFIPTITEFDNRIEFSGTVKYNGPIDNRSKSKKVIDNIICLLLLPIILIFGLYQAIKWVVCKLLKKPQLTREEKLFDLMENHLGCNRKEVS